MTIINLEEERNMVLEALNQEPYQYLTGKRYVFVNGKECKVVKNNLRGGIIVWTMYNSFDFHWDKISQSWF